MVAAPLPWVPAWVRGVPAKLRAANAEMHCPGPVGYVGLTLVFGVEVLLAAGAHVLANGVANAAYLAVALPLSCCAGGGDTAAAAAVVQAAPAEAAAGEP